MGDLQQCQNFEKQKTCYAWRGSQIVLSGFFKTLNLLIMLRWRQFARAPQFGKRLTGRILAGVVGAYFLLILLVMGYFLAPILRKAYPQANLPILVNRYVMHFFLTVIAARYFMQKMPAVQLQVFLTLPIRKSLLVLAYLLLVCTNGFNFAPIVIAVPFWLQAIWPAFAVTQSLFWLAGILFVSLASATVVLLIRIFVFDRPLLFVVFLLLLVALFLLDRLSVLAFLPWFSGKLFNSLLKCNWPALVATMASVGILVFILFQIMRRKLYLPTGM